MPPRKSTSSSSSKVEKRKPTASPPPPTKATEAESELSELEEEEDEAPKKKKAKKAPVKKGPVTPIHPDLPNNTAFPDPLEPFGRPQGEGTLRIASWNVAGLKACEKKGFSKYVEAEDADILCLNETKCESLALPSIDDRYPHRYWGIHHKKGQAGVAIFSKIEPISVVKGLPADLTTPADEKEQEEGVAHPPTQKESEGRIITLEFEKTFVIATYVPNAGQGLKTLPEKAAWNKSFETYLHSLDARKPVIWIGDFNVVPTELDIRNWKTNYNKSAGVTDTEINGFKSQLAGGQGGFVDVWREKNEGLIGHYSYFSYKFQCRVKGIGWRIDMAVTSKRILERVKQCEIRQSIYGASDHVPIIIDVEGPL
ncbi:exodeoxyribonuclease III [Sporobolomyces salmoneus]|uniref:exodeoxyribonuclease III n=1 Tax=Sporobolomyces salmoneus TaxID=183962 RepID=UPI003181599D